MPAMNDPATPASIVPRQPMGWRPGTARRPSPPTIRPPNARLMMNPITRVVSRGPRPNTTELADAVAAAVAERARVVVIAGTGGNFCAGADLSGVEDESFQTALRRLLLGVRDAPVPVIAAVEGAALGAGTQLAVACDLRVAAPDATFGIPAAKLGLMVDQWTAARLSRLAGEGPARAMLLAADVLSGEDAVRLGLAQRPGRVADAIAWAEA